MGRSAIACLCATLLAVVCAVAPAPSARCEGQGGDRNGPPSSFRLTNFSITLERAFYELGCPDHVITLRGDGTGERGCLGVPGGVGSSMTHFAVPREFLVSLLTTLYRQGFFDLQSRYRESTGVWVDAAGMVSVSRFMISPNPGYTVTFTVRIGNYSKTVVVESGDHPSFLDAIEAQMDELAESADSEPKAAR